MKNPHAGNVGAEGEALVRQLDYTPSEPTNTSKAPSEAGWFHHYQKWVDAHPARVFGEHIPDSLKPASKGERATVAAQIRAMLKAHPRLEWCRVTLPKSRFPLDLEPRKAFTQAREYAVSISKANGGAALIWCVHLSEKNGWHLHILILEGARLLARDTDRKPMGSARADVENIARYFTDPHLSAFRAEESQDRETGQIVRINPPKRGEQKWFHQLEMWCAQVAQDAQKHRGVRLPEQRGTVGFGRELQAATALHLVNEKLKG